MYGIKVRVDWETDEGKPSAPASSGADITSASVVASNERINHLQAIYEGGGTGCKGSGEKSVGVTDTGRRRQTIDEI